MYASLAFTAAGAAGETSTQVRARFAALLMQNPGIVVIECGANDASIGVSVETFATNIAAMVRAAHTFGVPAVVLSVPPKAALATSLPAARSYIERYNLWLRLNAGRLGFRLADIHPHLIDPATGNLAETFRSDLSDALHMNDRAHSLIARVLAEQIRAAYTTGLPPAPIGPTPANLVSGGYMTGAGNPPAGWSAGVGTGGSTSVVADSTGELPGGKWLQWSVPATGVVVSKAYTHALPSGSYAVGDYLAVSAMMQVIDNSGHWVEDASSAHSAIINAAVSTAGLFAITSSSDYATGRQTGEKEWTLGQTWSRGIATEAGHVAYLSCTAPAGGRAYDFRWGAVQVVNLTALGLVANP